jgi:hypothetical protein
VQDHDLAVGGGVHVELEIGGAEHRRERERRQRVFRGDTGRTAMAENAGPRR